MSIQPIPTTYRGVRFRSRLEARWAVFFDRLGIAWEYEPQGYRLKSGRCYLPDFWLPKFDGGIFAEVKPSPLAAGIEKQIEEFSREVGKSVWLCVGVPNGKTQSCFSPENHPEWPCWESELQPYVEEQRFWTGAEDAEPNDPVWKAAAAAQSERFGT